MSLTPTYKARSRQQVGRKPKQFEEGRRCIHPDCTTILSRYNRSALCSAHQPTRYPRQHGRSR